MGNGNWKKDLAALVAEGLGGSSRESLAQVMSRRTIEGIGALVGADRDLYQASAHVGLRGAAALYPERVGYLAAAAVNVVSSAMGWEKPRIVAKTTLMPLLAASVWRRRHETSRTTTTLLLIGLAGGWLGDLLLIPNKPNLNRGSAAFAVNHAAYHFLLWRAGARLNLTRAAIRFPLWGASLPVIAVAKPEMMPAAVGYGPMLATTSVLADDPALVSKLPAPAQDAELGLPVADPAYGLGHGANLFLISDVLLMTRKLVDEEGLLGRLLNAAVMDTYTVAQLLLVEGLLAVDRR